MEFQDKIAIVTGSAKGIGKECARQLAMGGATVILADLDGERARASAQEICCQGGKAHAYEVNLTDVEAVQKMAADVIKTHGAIHILVNNAGIYGITPVEDITLKEWDLEHSINLRGAFFLIQSVLEQMKVQGYGKIVNLSSIAGRNGGLEAGVIGMTRGLAAKLAPYNIHVNCVAPGPTMTDMFQKLDEQRREKVRLTIPLRKFGTPEDIANAVAFLASDKAGFITGAVLDVNGGMYMG